MSDIFNKLKRGGKEIATEATRMGGHGSVSGEYSNRKESGSRVSQATVNGGSSTNIDSKFYSRANKTEISVDVDKGTGYSKKG